MNSAWKKVFKLLCLLIFAGVFSACIGNEARLISPPECVDPSDCASGQCVDFTCVGGVIDTKLPDASTPDAEEPDALLPDAEEPDVLPDTTEEPDTCTGESCDEVTCDPPFFWDAAAQACVQCRSNAECTEPGASNCSGQGVCVACALNAHCAHLDDATLCVDGTCSQCSPEDESACGPNACNPATHTCTTTARGSVFTCNKCLSDSECAPDHACAPMDFQGATRSEFFCLPLAAEKTDLETGCHAPYPNRFSRLSASGVPTEICTLNEQLTTCEALLQYGGRCADASDCGAEGFFDSLCEPIDFGPAACTFPCSSSEECPTNSDTGCMEGSPDIYYCGAW